MQDIFEKVRKMAGTYFDRGYNCAQAVALSNVELLGGRLEGSIEMAAGFGRGMSAGCTCGALSGGVMALGLLLAGPDPKGFDEKISAAAAGLHRKFVGEFGQTCCRGLRKKLSPFKNARCRLLTVTTAALTVEVLLEQKQLASAPVGVHSL